MLGLLCLNFEARSLATASSRIESCGKLHLVDYMGCRHAEGARLQGGRVIMRPNSLVKICLREIIEFRQSQNSRTEAG